MEGRSSLPPRATDAELHCGPPGFVRLRGLGRERHRRVTGSRPQEDHRFHAVSRGSNRGGAPVRSETCQGVGIGGRTPGRRHWVGSDGLYLDGLAVGHGWQTDSLDPRLCDHHVRDDGVVRCVVHRDRALHQQPPSLCQTDGRVRSRVQCGQVRDLCDGCAGPPRPSQRHPAGPGPG